MTGPFSIMNDRFPNEQSLRLRPKYSTITSEEGSHGAIGTTRSEVVRKPREFLPLIRTSVEELWKEASYTKMKVIGAVAASKGPGNKGDCTTREVRTPSSSAEAERQGREQPQDETTSPVRGEHMT